MWIAKTILRNQVGGLILSDVNGYYKATVIDTGRKKYMDHWYRIESEEINCYWSIDFQ